MPKVTIDGNEIEVAAGTTILRAAELLDIKVPYFCYHPGLSVPANCRVCLIEIEGQWKLQPACYTTVSDGMVVNTHSEKVEKARRGILEFILVNHPVDCPICDQAGECWLQDHYLAYDFVASRQRTAKVAKTKVHPIGPKISFDGERCILCTRCIRFCRDISKTRELTRVERSDATEIRTFPGQKLDNPYSMCTVDLCPVGALTSREFRFKERAWNLKATKSVCTGCARTCSINIDHYREHPHRFVPRYNPAVNKWWMCDQGRLSCNQLLNDRLLEIQVDNKTYEYWPQALRQASARIQAASGEGKQWALVLSPKASTEALLAAVSFADAVLGEARLFRGGRPDGKADDLLICADKNPNNAGIDKVTEGRDVLPFSDLFEAIEGGQVTSLYLMNPDLPVDEEQSAQFLKLLEKLDLFVLHSTWQGDLAEKADIALPAASHAEQTGTFINCDGVVQVAEAAYPPVNNSKQDVDIFLLFAEILKAPLPDQQPAFEALELVPYEPPEDTHPADFHRAPHGPDRMIPGREATAEPVKPTFTVKSS